MGEGQGRECKAWTAHGRELMMQGTISYLVIHKKHEKCGALAGGCCAALGEEGISLQMASATQSGKQEGGGVLNSFLP